MLNEREHMELLGDLNAYCEAWHNQAVAWNGVRDTSATRKAIHALTDMILAKWNLTQWSLNQLALVADSRTPDRNQLEYYMADVIRDAEEAREENEETEEELKEAV